MNRLILIISIFFCVPLFAEEFHLHVDQEEAHPVYYFLQDLKQGFINERLEQINNLDERGELEITITPLRRGTGITRYRAGRPLSIEIAPNNSLTIFSITLLHEFEHVLILRERRELFEGNGELRVRYFEGENPWRTTVVNETNLFRWSFLLYMETKSYLLERSLFEHGLIDVRSTHFIQSDRGIALHIDHYYLNDHLGEELALTLFQLSQQSESLADYLEQVSERMNDLLLSR